MSRNRLCCVVRIHAAVLYVDPPLIIIIINFLSEYRLHCDTSTNKLTDYIKRMFIQSISVTAAVHKEFIRRRVSIHGILCIFPLLVV